jgi:hypothetical protein
MNLLGNNGMLKLSNPIDVLVYPHIEFNPLDGGIIATYQLANVLHEAGLNVRINGHHGKILNPLFNNFYNDDLSAKKIVAIYCECIAGNPLKAKMVVRWMLSQLGRNIVPKSYISTWGKKDLVYFFNSQRNFSENKNHIFKLLTTLYINPIYRDLGIERNGVCYTTRKKTYFTPSKSLTIDIKKNWFEIDRNFNDYLNIFNKCQYFVSYDPLTFMTFIAALCGCIAIVNPCEGMDKKTWLQNTGLWPYLVKNGLDNINGIAYGMDDVQHAINTRVFLREQLLDFCKFCQLETVNPFIKDIKNFYRQPNTVEAVFKTLNSRLMI